MSLGVKGHLLEPTEPLHPLHPDRSLRGYKAREKPSRGFSLGQRSQAERSPETEVPPKVELSSADSLHVADEASELQSDAFYLALKTRIALYIQEFISIAVLLSFLRDRYTFGPSTQLLKPWNFLRNKSEERESFVLK